MNIALRGASPAVMAAGILLLSRSRQLGQRVRVEIVGDPGDIGVVSGPAILHSVALAGCGVGREFGSGGTVVVPGPAEEPLAVSLSADGRGDWFYVDRSGQGHHPATRAFVRLMRERQPAARSLVRQVRRGLEWLGCAAEPVVLDLAFGAATSPLSRISVALRTGRAISGQRGEPVTRILTGELADDLDEISLDVALGRFLPDARAAMTDALRSARQLDPTLYAAIEELVTHFALLPTGGILPILDPAMDAVAYGLPRALTATVGNPEAQSVLLETYRFLGGRFVSHADHAIELSADLPPADRLGRWKWFCTDVATAAVRVERIWRDLMDEPQ